MCVVDRSQYCLKYWAAASHSLQLCGHAQLHICMWCRGLNAWTVRLLNRKIAFTEARLSAITSLAGDVDACSLDGECAFQMRASANLGPLESVLSDNDFSPQKLSELVNGTVRNLRCPHVWHAHHLRQMHAGTIPMRIHELPLLPSAAGPQATHICVRLKTRY